MKKYEVINNRKDFNKVYSRGKSIVSPALVMYFIKNYKKGLRYGITASKKIGNAVCRNRARRVIKESFRKINLDENRNLDIVFVARKQTTKLKSTVVQKEMLFLLKKSGIFKKEKDEKSFSKIN